MMQQIKDHLETIDRYLGSSPYFVYLLLGTGIFFTLYLGFPQIRYFRHAIRVVAGKFDRKGDKGDTSHFQALTTALSGTVGTGNIAGVAFAIYLGGPAALFWMLATALVGMTTKFVEVLLSHKYRETDEFGFIAGGPMYYMKNRLNIRRSNGKLIRTGFILGGIFAVSTIFSSFGTGNLPQMNSISNALYLTLHIDKEITGAVLAILLGLVIIGGIKRIAKVTASLVPTMALIYFIGALAVLISNYQNILPSIASIFTDIFTGSAALGGFLGAGIRFAIQKGVTRGLFSNEAGQGSAPIAHAAARAHEPVSEGMVAILEPFIDTVIICMITGITILSSGVWHEKHTNDFQNADTKVITGIYADSIPEHKEALYLFLKEKSEGRVRTFEGQLTVRNGIITDMVTVINARSVAENVKVRHVNGDLFTGKISCSKGVLKLKDDDKKQNLYLSGSSLVHSAPLTALAFRRGLFGNFGQYIVAIGLLLFAFSTAISWSYYGDRAVTYLFGKRRIYISLRSKRLKLKLSYRINYITIYRLIYVAGFFLAAIIDTDIVWSFSAITIALMTIPNLLGLLLLRREIRQTIREYWTEFRRDYPKGKE